MGTKTVPHGRKYETLWAQRWKPRGTRLNQCDNYPKFMQ